MLTQEIADAVQRPGCQDFLSGNEDPVVGVHDRDEVPLLESKPLANVDWESDLAFFLNADEFSLW